MISAMSHADAIDIIESILPVRRVETEAHADALWPGWRSGSLSPFPRSTMDGTVCYLAVDLDFSAYPPVRDEEIYHELGHAIAWANAGRPPGRDWGFPPGLELGCLDTAHPSFDWEIDAVAIGVYCETLNGLLLEDAVRRMADDYYFDFLARDAGLTPVAWTRQMLERGAQLLQEASAMADKKNDDRIVGVSSDRIRVDEVDFFERVVAEPARALLGPLALTEEEIASLQDIDFDEFNERLDAIIAARNKGGAS